MLDTCKNCPNQFKRHYLRKGVRQIYCSKSCRYKSSFVERACKTCKQPYQVNKLSTRKEYCSLACIQRKKCLVCSRLITGRKTFQSKERQFCGRSCAAHYNFALNGKKNYVVKGFAYTIKRLGTLQCELCSHNSLATLVVHHLDKNHQNNELTNLQTLCQNCHAEVHWNESSARARNIKVAKSISHLIS